MKIAAMSLLLLCTAGCAKKEPKPLRTEPWLAHPPASARPSGDATLPLTRYLLDDRSVIRFELPSKRGALHGSISRVSGQLGIDLSDLTRTRGSIRADLGSLEIHAATSADGGDAAVLERARAALELPVDGGAKSAFASFELRSVEDVAPTQIEPAPERDAGVPFNRRARFSALGDLLLHGFRVGRRAPLEAEFGFAGSREVPETVLIRSRAPFVVSLETHAVLAVAPESRAAGPTAPPARLREAHVSVELYATKTD